MISVILLTHNYAKYLPKCLNSIMKNDNSLIGEIIIINDNSTDNTDEIISKYQLTNSKIKYFKTKYLSLTKSYNFAVRKSRFEFITKVDADDMLEKNFLKDFFEQLKKNEYDFIYGNIKVSDSLGRFKFIKKQKKNFINSFFNYPLGSGTIFKKKLWQQIGGFDEKIKYQDDYDFWLKIKKIKDVKLGYFSNEGYIYRMHDKNMSKSFFKKNLTKIFVLINNIL